jgi:hypothetical protein
MCDNVDVNIVGEMGNFLRAVLITLKDQTGQTSATYSLDRESYEQVGASLFVFFFSSCYKIKII